MTENAVYIKGYQIITPLGSGTAAVLDAMESGQTGVRVQTVPDIQGKTVCAALFTEQQKKALLQEAGDGFSLFESMLLAVIRSLARQETFDFTHPRSLMVIASTKGNIGLLSGHETDPQTLSSLEQSGKKLASALNYHSQPLIISNACISGMSAILVARRLIRAGLYDRALVAGADCISSFVVAGFQSFQALSNEICLPFDKERKGINLGEGSAAMLLTKEPAEFFIGGGASSSDANHISGPSRTGEEMAVAINRAMDAAGLQAKDLGFVSAHGTATLFNDEMESKAFMLSHLDKIPVFSLKPYFGHTLGASGLLESAISLEAMRRNWVLGSKGYKEHGVSQPISISTQTDTTGKVQHCLKTGSGFGGCNAALVFSKNKTSVLG